MRRRRRSPRPGAWWAALALAACAGPGEPAGYLPPGPAVVALDLAEYRFSFQSPVPAGRVLFEVTNAGHLPHRVTLVPLDDDLPPIDEQLRGQQRRLLPPFAGLTDRPPGGRGAFAVDLEAGRRYAFLCFVVGEDGRPHALLGMNAEFRPEPAGRAGPGGPGSTAPS